jgi:AcrR family transcriptional regulator
LNSSTLPILSLNERKQALARETIWQAAIDLFREKGFEETTLDDITTAAGTSRRSFFRYFESKSDLLVQPIVSYGDFITDAIRNCPSEYSAAQVLRHTLLMVAENSASKPHTKQLIELAAKYPSARQAQVARFAQVQDKVAEAYAERFEGPMPRILASLTHSLLSISFQRWFEGDQKDIAADVEEVLGTLREVACAMKTR